MKRAVLGSLLVLLGASFAAHADTVTFKNGDKLTGAFVKVTGGSLALKSDVLGDVTIPLDKVQSVAIANPAVIVGTDQKLVRGQVEFEAPGDWKVTSNGASQTVAIAKVNIIVPEDVYHKTMEVPAKPWQDWKGSANLGYSIQHGDQQTHSLSATAAATRERPTDLLFEPHFRTNYGLTMLLAKAQQDGSEVTSNTLSTNLREDFLFSPSNFVFGLAQIDHVDAQGLYLQQTYGGGVGRDLLHTKDTLFSVLGGIDYLHQKFDSGSDVSTVEAMVGEKLGMQIGTRLRFDHHLNFYPDLQNGGQYHFDTAANLAFKISSRFTANAGAIDLYLTNPAPGAHNNNIALTTGFGVTF